MDNFEEVGVGDLGPVVGLGEVSYGEAGHAFTVAVIIVETKSVPAIGVTALVKG